MSLFSSQGIILRIQKLKDKQELYTIFTREYGSIQVTRKYSQRNKPVDLGTIISSEIETKPERDIHTIRNLKIRSQFDAQRASFEMTHRFLLLLHYAYTHLPLGHSIPEVFEVLSELAKIQSPETQDILLSQLKIMDILWNLDIEHQDATIKKILRFIHESPIQKVLKLTGLKDEDTQKLEEVCTPNT